MKYEVTRSCGHIETVALFGPGSTRKYILKKEAERACQECRAEENAQASASNANRAKEMELPQLTGSAKQVQWAETLRMQFVDGIDAVIEHYKSIADYVASHAKEDAAYAVKSAEILKQDIDTWNGVFGDQRSITPEAVSAVINYILTIEISASFWIDKRNSNTSSLIENYAMLNRKTIIKSFMEEEAPVEAQAPVMIAPEKKIKSGYATISVSADNHVITAKYEKDEDFRAVCKEHSLTWSQERGAWTRKPSQTTAGDIIDRAAGLAVALLAAGFAVEIKNSDVYQKAINPEAIVPEQRNWVIRIDDNTMGIRFERDDTLYKRARSLPGAWWNKDEDCIAIKPMHFAEIRDFVRLYGFSVTDRAEAILHDAEAAQKIALVVNAKPVKAERQTDAVKDILTGDDEIIPDLKDN